METEPCSGSSSVVDKKRKRKRKKSNRNVSDLGMDKEDYFPEKNSSVNVIISLPSAAESSSAQENSKAQPCNELNPLPAKKKILETSTTQGDIGAEVPYYVLQANEPDVKDNITCSSSNSHQSLEHEKSLPSTKANILARRRERKKEKRKFFKRMRKEEELSGKSDTLTEIPNSVSQVAELDKNILKEFSSTSGKESVIEKNLCSLEKEDVDGEAHTLLSDFSNMSTSSKKKSVEKLKTDSRKKPPSRLTTGTVDFSEDLVHKETSFHSDETHISHLSDSKSKQVDERIQVTLGQASIGTLKAEASVHNPEQRLDLPEKPETIKLHSAAEVFLVESAAVTGATENKYTEKLFQVHTAEEHVSRVDKGIEAAFNCNGEASVDSGLVSCCEHSNGNDVKVNRQIKEVNPSSELLVSKGDIKLDININKGSMPLQIPEISSERTSAEPSKKKLLILDLNGLLADVRPHVDYRYKPGLMVSREAVFKRPFVDDFLQFCFEKFAVGVWSSRTKRNLDPVVDFLMGDSKGKLLFCWDQSYCTITKFATIENRDKPLVLKELRKLWDKLESNLPWEKGAYNESNTLLLDDSPYKALCNPANTGIFPYSYHYRDAKDNSLGTGGDLRVYLESLALADDVRKYVVQNPFGQRAITKSNPDWNYYKRVLAADSPEDATSISK
ncbi:uncharacterized protein LOC115665375 isoform X1 [Syzygium oleosum]|uniref:uncharacterized protein LOC115665375 isoform X1 n=1 Tax=Syzygium oleosum TaxID=219896 RepID=UPI0024B91DD0|nr:uncharacterized protein LOC115665375 isoform X1 [Syzygium oleosum]XP_030443113.2 uncharacterized protein LOC115665375 isoform X1 [Syzygium oleosum]